MKINAILDAHNNDTYLFTVTVGDSTYHVSFSEAYYQKLTSGRIKPLVLVEKSFEFLLSNEKPSQILPEFDLPLINQYFPDYESSIQRQV